MKKSTQRITLVALVAAAVMSIASAQEDFQQGPPPPGGPGFQGGPQGGPGMGPRGPQGGPAILMFPPVREELKLTEDQVEKLQNVLPRPEPGKRIDREEIEKAEKGIQSILSKAQYQRYREISLQMGGPGAMTRPEVAKELGLSEEQVKKIQQILEANRPQGGPGGRGQGGPGGQGRRGQGGPGGGFGDQGGPGGPPPGGGFGGPGQGGPGGPGGQGGPGGPGGPPPGGGFGGPGQGGPGQGGFGRGGRGQGGPGGPGMGPGGMDPRRKELEEKVMAVLTDAQKAKWKDMLGKPFQPKPPRRDRDDD